MRHNGVGMNTGFTCKLLKAGKINMSTKLIAFVKSYGVIMKYTAFTCTSMYFICVFIFIGYTYSSCQNFCMKLINLKLVYVIGCRCGMSLFLECSRGGVQLNIRKIISLKKQ